MLKTFWSNLNLSYRSLLFPWVLNSTCGLPDPLLPLIELPLLLLLPFDRPPPPPLSFLEELVRAATVITVGDTVAVAAGTGRWSSVSDSAGIFEFSLLEDLKEFFKKEKVQGKPKINRTAECDWRFIHHTNLILLSMTYSVVMVTEYIRQCHHNLWYHNSYCNYLFTSFLD